MGQGLRVDLERLEDDPVARLLEGLRREGVSEEILDRALGDASARPSQ